MLVPISRMIFLFNIIPVKLMMLLFSFISDGELSWARGDSLGVHCSCFFIIVCAEQVGGGGGRGMAHYLLLVPYPILSPCPSYLAL